MRPLRTSRRRPERPAPLLSEELRPVRDFDAAAAIAAVVDGLRAGFDPEWGGFGPAPKFPRPTLVELCLRQARVHQPDADLARRMGVGTLDAMAAGGIYDHIVGGFCRYSTDARWLVPHFEKMLTDQALLARAYLHAWQDGGRSDYMGVVTETLDWVLRDLSTPEGALYSSFDADAGGVEGGHATFTPDELREILPPELVEPAADWYGITETGNWEGRSIPVRPVGAPLTPAARDRRGPRPPRRRPRPPSPAGARREGPDRVERHGRRHAGRGRLRHRAHRVRASRRGDRHLPLGRPCTSTAA